MLKFINSLKSPSGYLTLFYGLTLGLALILALLTIYLHGKARASSVASATTQVGSTQTPIPTRRSTQAQSTNTPTTLPTIQATPNDKMISSLSVTEAELQGVQVDLWHPWTGVTGATLVDILDEFNRTNQWGISVQASAYEGFGKLDEVVESALLTNTQPDMILDYGYQAQHWDEVQALVDLTPYVNDPVWGLTSDEQSDFYPSFWGEDIVTDYNTGQTRRLGIPYYRSAYVLFYNQSWAKELGYPTPPITVEEFRERACAAAQYVTELGDKSSLGKGGWLITSQPGLMVGWIYAFGGGITDPNMPGYLFNTPETRQSLEYLKGLQSSGCAWADITVDPQDEFANRNTLFLVGSLFDIPAQELAFAQAGSEDEWVVTPFPSSSQPVVDTYGPSVLITRSNPADQLAAWLVTKWLVSPPNQAEWVAKQETLPTRPSTLDYMAENMLNNPQWTQALKLLPDARSEPSLTSWSMMRWALEDLMIQLFDPQQDTKQIPALLEELDRVADEIYTQVH